MARLVDTSIWVTLERRKFPLTAVSDMAPSEPVALASITVSELLIGALRANTPSRRSQREAFVELLLARFPVIAFDDVVARVHARLWADLAARGRPIGPNDLLIAATAVAMGYDVLTADVAEFQRVPGLTVVRPNW